MTRGPFLTYRGVEPPLVVPFVHMKSKKEKYALWGANVADRNGGVRWTTYNMNNGPQDMTYMHILWGEGYHRKVLDSCLNE